VPEWYGKEGEHKLLVASKEKAEAQLALIEAQQVDDHTGQSLQHRHEEQMERRKRDPLQRTLRIAILAAGFTICWITAFSRCGG
jgi:hypothetical protein